MQDEMIVDLYWQRNENAILETEQKYGPYLTKIAYNILADFEDSKERVNDTYLKAWNSMPPHRPSVLSTYLGKITRQLSIDWLRTQNRAKRKSSEYALSLSELEDCVAGRRDQCISLHSFPGDQKYLCRAVLFRGFHERSVTLLWQERSKGQEYALPGQAGIKGISEKGGL